MSSRLPQELFDAILDKLAEPPDNYGEYREIKDTFVNTCRASRLLRSAAQPGVWRHIWLQDMCQLEPVATSPLAAELGACTTTYVYSVIDGSRETVLHDALDVVDLFPAIVDMWLLFTSFARGLLPARLQHLSSHTKLRYLSLVRLDIVELPSGALPNLEMLDMCTCSMPLGAARAWLHPLRLPSVRVLNLVCVVDERSSPLQLEHIIAPSLLPQLDCVQLDVAGLVPDSELANGVVPPFLFIDPNLGTAPLPRHSMPIRFENAVVADIGAYLSVITLAMRVSSAAAPLVVLLPRSMGNIARKYADADTARALRRLEAMADACAVRIMWVSESDRWDPRIRLSSEFRAYGRELRLAREAAA